MPVKTAIAGRFSAEEWDLLRAVDGVELVDLTEWGGWSRPSQPGADGPALAKLRANLVGVEAILLMGSAQPIVGEAHDVKWIQVPWAGLDQIASTGVFERGITITNGRGLNARYVAEWGIAAIVALAKRFPRYFHLQLAKGWERHQPIHFRDATVGIVGMGAIGTELAQLATALGMRVIGTRRSGPHTPPQGIDWIGGPDDLDRVLAEADFVVLAAPNTNETRRLIGADQLRAMKPTAHLVNLARGSLVDEAALVQALRDGTIAGAALDVFETEPLPPSSPLWDLDNVILTSHISGMNEGYFGRVLRLFIHNLERYVGGQPLVNVCDAEKGY